jgi:hypothetical protein
LNREQELVLTTQQWLEERADTVPAYAQYLENWGEWKNPWEESQ